MALTSSGSWLSIGRQVTHSIHAPNIAPVRGLHTRIPHQPSPSTAQRLVKHTTGLFKAFIGHLTTPGTLRQPVGVGRALHTAATRGPTIQSGLSLPVRHALSRPLGAPRLPRPPVVPRSITQVGLGTARNFTTGRPIFQSLADNVPITGRAFVEADWDMRLKDEKKQKARKGKRSEKAKGKKAMRLADTKVHFHPAASAAVVDKENAAELEHYFPAPAAPAVSTTLLVPLAPTPTSRLPLLAVPSTSHPLLPFADLSKLHYDHQQHALRVSGLFDCLDSAKVWESGAECDVYGDYHGASVLRVRFAGWEAKAVRGVIGESGSGWCVLEEEREDDPGESEVEDLLEHMSASGVSDFSHAFGDHPDPAQSFVLPTLDFSASSPVYSPPPSLPRSPLSDRSSDIGSFSDFDMSRPGSAGPGSWAELAPAPIQAGSWLGFSSTFSERLEGPREAMF